ncbi:MAG: FKBP-type peptidyl-prolyl cis-trans isomerase [Elusimicrobiota bacterium]
MKRAAAILLLLSCARAGRALEISSSTVDRVRLNVKDLPAEISWLDKTLGWRPSYRNDKRAVLSASGLKLELDAADVDSAITLALSSDDADADYHRLLDRGAVSIEAPSDRPSGFREAYLRGPGGLTLEIDGPLAQSPELIFTEISPGTGETPVPSDTVKVRYVGTLSDGTVFDEIHRKGRPAMIPLESAVRCWTQALTRMKVGGRAKFVCPPELAYGKKGRPPYIPPNAALVFDVELVGVLH